MFSVHIVKKIESRKVIVLEMIFFFKKESSFLDHKNLSFQDFSHSKTFFFRKKMHLFFLRGNYKFVMRRILVPQYMKFLLNAKYY